MTAFKSAFRVTHDAIRKASNVAEVIQLASQISRD